jgi:hypothetical protein
MIEDNLRVYHVDLSLRPKNMGIAPIHVFKKRKMGQGLFLAA